MAAAVDLGPWGCMPPRKLRAGPPYRYGPLARRDFVGPRWATFGPPLNPEPWAAMRSRRPVAPGDFACGRNTNSAASGHRWAKSGPTPEAKSPGPTAGAADPLGQRWASGPKLVPGRSIQRYDRLTAEQRAAAWEVFDEIVIVATQHRRDGWRAWELDPICSVAREHGVYLWPAYVAAVKREVREALTTA